MNPVAHSAVARALSFVPTAIATLITSRLIISHFGVTSFDSFALVLALISLVPLNNLGVGAAVTSAYAQDGPDSDQARRVTLTAARVLTVSSLGTAVVSLLLGAAGLWPTLLGAASGPNLWCAVAVAVYAMSFLPGLGQSMLLGVHRNHVTVVVQTFFTPLIAIGVVAVISFGLSGSVAMVVPPAALVAINVVTSVIATRATGVSLVSVLRAVPRRRLHPGKSIRAMSGPVLVITLATPIALQSDRIVLSHVSTAHAVANYSVAMQIFAPALALIAASAQPLWPIWTKARSEGRRGPGLGKVLLAFCGLAVLMGAVLAVISNPIGHLIGGTSIHLGVLLPVAGGLAVLTAAMSYPVAMNLMNPTGARFIAICTLVALPLNVGLSIVLGRRYGAPGPLFASVLVGIAVQSLPGIVYSRRLSTVGRHRASQKPRRLGKPAGTRMSATAAVPEFALDDPAVAGR